MDKLFYASVVTRERKAEISKDLAISHMLKEAEGDLPGVTGSKRMLLRFAVIIIVIFLIMSYFIG